MGSLHHGKDKATYVFIMLEKHKNLKDTKTPPKRKKMVPLITP
jgi:hypothetical protein